MISRLLGKKPDIKTLQTIGKDQVPWASETALVFVNNGFGKLDFVVGQSKNEYMTGVLVLNGIPLVKWHDESYGCPTCERLLAGGYGMDKVGEETLTVVRNASRVESRCTSDVVQEIKALLALLKTGLYMITDLPLYPTDGGGHFFWHMSNLPMRYSAARDTYYNCRYQAGYPAFLIPTQTPNRFDEKRVAYYCNQIRDGEKLGGIAYHVDGYLCALLDGHHRATAAFLEHSEFRCLTIIPVTSWVRRISTNEEFVTFCDKSISLSELPKDVVKILIKNGRNTSRISDRKMARLLSLENGDWEARLPEKMTQKAKQYPTHEGVAAVEWAGDLSDKRISGLLNSTEHEVGEEMDLVFKALITLNDKRAYDLALNLGKSEVWISFWEDAFHYIKGYDSDEVEDFFINYLLEYGNFRPNLKRIADEYLSKR